MKTYLIPIIIAVIVLVTYFSISPTTMQENSLSRQCDIPYDENFVRQRIAPSAPNDGKPHYSIAHEFSIYSTVPIGEFSVDETAHSLILKPVPTSHGYIIMCDPLPVLEKRLDKKMDGLMILVDDEEIEYKIINNVLKINVNNNTRIEIIEDDTISENKKPYTLYDISGVKQIYKTGEPISFTEIVQGYANPCVSPHYEILDGNTLETVWQYKIVYPCPFIKDPQQFKTINTVPNDDIPSPILNQTGHYILRSYYSYSDGYKEVTFSVVDESVGERDNEN